MPEGLIAAGSHVLLAKVEKLDDDKVLGNVLGEALRWREPADEARPALTTEEVLELVEAEQKQAEAEQRASMRRRTAATPRKPSTELAIADSITFKRLRDHGYMERLRPHTRIWARTSPTDKVLVLQLHMRAGFVCSMTGDGGNDCGALREAPGVKAFPDPARCVSRARSAPPVAVRAKPGVASTAGRGADRGARGCWAWAPPRLAPHLSCELTAGSGAAVSKEGPPEARKARAPAIRKDPTLLACHVMREATSVRSLVEGRPYRGLTSLKPDHGSTERAAPPTALSKPSIRGCLLRRCPSGGVLAAHSDAVHRPMGPRCLETDIGRVTRRDRWTYG